MLKAEMAPCFVMAMLLIPTPTVADVTSELARCELEAERLYQRKQLLLALPCRQQALGRSVRPEPVTLIGPRASPKGHP